MRELEETKRQEDPYAIRATGIPAHCTEADVIDEFRKYGRVEGVFIPITEGSKNRPKIAIVRYKTREEATKAVTKAEVVIEFACIKIERALQRRSREKDGIENREAFAQLKRRD